MWTFSYSLTENLKWQVSARRFETIKEASFAVAAWLEVCAENDVICSVKLVKLNSNHS